MLIMLLNALVIKSVRCGCNHASELSYRVLIRIVPIVLILNVSFLDTVGISTAAGGRGALVRVERLSEALGLLH